MEIKVLRTIEDIAEVKDFWEKIEKTNSDISYINYEFIKNYDLETQLCLLEDSMPLLSIIMNASDDQQKLFMNYSCQRLKLTSADNNDEDSANAITRLDYRLNVLKNAF